MTLSSVKTVSLVIPTYNKVERLRIMLASLANLNDLENVEIIVVNDGSTDGTYELLKKHENMSNYKFKAITIENGGRSTARNIGVSEAGGELIIFTDDDLILDKMFIRSHKNNHGAEDNMLVHGCIYNLPYVKFFKDPSVGSMIDGSPSKEGMLKYLITPEIVLHDMCRIEKQKRLTKFEKDIHELLNYIDVKKYQSLRWASCTGGNISVKKNVFEAAGGFDEYLGREWGCEDLELGYRLSLMGVKFKLDLNAVNYHMSHFRGNSEALHHKAFEYFINKHNDICINYLLDYFEGRRSSLCE